MEPSIVVRPRRAASRARPPLPFARLARALGAALLLLLAAGAALAQAPADDPGLAPTELRGDDPADLADRAVERWLASESRTLADLAALDAETVCRELPGLFAAPPPPPGTEVDLSDGRERPTDDENRTRFTYAAEVPPDRLDVVEVILVRDGDGWAVERVGFQLAETGGRDFLQSRTAGIVFALITLAFLVGVARPSPLRRWLAFGAASVREHRRLVIVTMVAGWAIVGVGLWSGAQLPDACEEAVLTILGSTLDQVGANQALASGDVARTALVIFYQNFLVVTVTALFGSALLLGVPAYLLAGASFLAQSTAFGVLGLGGFPEIVLIAVLFVLEFTSYFLVVAGGGMLVATLVRGGLSQIGLAYRKLTATLPWAAALLLIGAWYEAAILLL
jgi:hypothetical protein